MNRKERRTTVKQAGDGDAFDAAVQMHGAGRLAEAVLLYRKALRRVQEPIIYYNLGVALMQLGALEDAAKALRRAIDLSPGYTKALSNLGIVLAELDQLGEAEEVLRKALAGETKYAESWNNLAIVLRDQGRLDEAAAACREALALIPDYPDAHNSLGIILHEQGRLDQATACYREALRLSPQFTKAHFNLALVHLLRGNYAEGWREYEWRWQGGARNLRPRPFAQPQWGGEPLQGRRLLLHAEQGFGDSLQFLRFVSMAAASAGEVILEVPRALARLSKTVAGVNRVVVAGDRLPPFDVHLPLMSLARVMDVTLERLPAEVPYIQPEADQVGRWRERLPPVDTARIGLVWSGDPRPYDARANATDRRRSIALSRLRPLLDLPRLSFVSLQIGEPARQMAELPAAKRFTDLTDGIADFADTAALVANLDLVITVDTAVAHLAGAMGKPVWIFSRFDGCWRWLTDRPDSPWFPTARLFRQPAAGDWDTPINEAAEALSLFASHHSGSGSR